jgi:sodium/proline symporter
MVFIMSTDTILLVTFSVYLLTMIAIGWVAYQRTRNVADYFLGGRQLRAWPAALSAGASDMSGWLLLGLPGLAFVDVRQALWLAGGLLLGTYCNWRFVASRLRRYTVIANNALTIPVFLAHRFGDRTHLLRISAALFILLFFVFYTSAGLVAGGKLFQTLFDLDAQVAMLIGLGCILSYTLIGGFLAVSWTDLVQGLLMAAALLIVPIAAFSALPHQTIALESTWITQQLTSMQQPLPWLSVLSLVAWGLGYFGQPHILARFAGIHHEQAIPTARRIAVTWTGFTLVGALLVGVTGYLYTQSYNELPIHDAETIFMVLVQALFHPVISGILLAAILAAIMSTADSQLLVASSAFTEDLYHLYPRSESSSHQRLRISRLSVILLAVIALWLALLQNQTVLGLVAYAWAGFGAAFGPVLLLSLYWPRMNQWGALAGMVTGAGMVALWASPIGGWWGLYEIIPGVISATCSCVIVTLLTPPPPSDIVASFKRFQNAESL